MAKLNRDVRGRSAYWRDRVVLGVTGLCVTLVSPTAAFAQTNPEGLFQSIVDLLTGNLARLGAIAAIAFCGWRIMTGNGDRDMLLRIIFGICLIFGGAWIVDQLMA